jgi:hypothetical protein
MRSIGLVWASCLTAAATAGGIGPDVIVGDLFEVGQYIPRDGYRAYSIGTDSCNIGDEPLQWVANTDQHPVIAQNMYRITPGGRFLQIGQSWVKHGFQALAGSLCGQCQNPGTGSLLGVGCSDPYTAGHNGSLSTLGPRSEVDPWTGVFAWPHGQPAVPIFSTSARIRVSQTELDAPGSRYYIEGHYVTPDDSAAGNQNNNVSWRPVTMDTGTYDFAVAESTRREEVALRAWAEFDPSVEIDAIDVPGEGRLNLGARATDLGDGSWLYEYVVHNQTSHRAVGGLTIATSASGLGGFGFHAPESHSGEPYSNAPWSVSEGARGVSWRTDPFDLDPDANAIRWGTAYTFWLVAPAPPVQGEVRVELFRPGTPMDLPATTIVPGSAACSPADVAPPFGVLDLADVQGFIGAFVAGDSAADLAAPFGVLDLADLQAFIAAFNGGCP